MFDKLKLLLISNAFFPEMSPRSYRATELAKEFSRQGHEVVVITKFRNYSYTDFLRKNPVTIKMWKGDKWSPVKIIQRSPWNFITRGVKRILMILFEYPAIEDMFHVKRMLKVENNHDLMISFSVPYPVHWGTAWASSSKNQIAKRWIADCGDPYMGDVLDSFRKPFYFAFLEKWFCRKADFITIPVQSAKSAYYTEFHHKIRVIPQGFNFNLNKIKENRISRGIPEFAYAGSFLKGIRDPGPLLNFLSQTNLPFKFYVFTDQCEYLGNYKEILKNKLVISGYIPRDELLERLSEMDFLVNLDNNTTLNIPSKLIDYSLTGRPVLNISKDFSVDDIIAFLSGDYSEQMQLPDPGQFHIRIVATQFLNLVSIDSE